MTPETAALRVAFVDGVTVSKWARVWSERMPGVQLELVRTDDADQATVLHRGVADMSFVRLPLADDGLSVIPLYSEAAFVVVAKDHPVALYDSVTLADIAGEDRLDGSDDDAFALAAAGAGVLVVPQSIARLRSRRDVVSRPVTDAPETRIGLAWRVEDPSDRIEEFIGIVRGRTARSSRGAVTAPLEAPKKAVSKRTASGSRRPRGRAQPRKR